MTIVVQKYLGVVLILVACTGCAGKSWFSRRGNEAGRTASALPSQRMSHRDAALAADPATHGELTSTALSFSDQSQQPLPPHPLVDGGLPGAASPAGQRSPTPADYAQQFSTPPAGGSLEARTSEYRSVYEEPPPTTAAGNTAAGELKQAIAEVIRESLSSTTAGEPQTVAAAPGGTNASVAGTSGASTLSPAERRAAAFNVNDEQLDSPNEPTAAPAADNAEGESPAAAPAAKGEAARVGEMASTSGAVVPASHTTPASEAPAQPGAWRAATQAALAALEQELASDALTAQQRSRLNANTRLLHAILNDSEKALEPIEEVGEDERGYWKHVTMGLLHALDADEKNTAGRRSALALGSLRKAADHLANLSTLDLRNLAFCRRVISYGYFDEFDSNGFKPGQEVLLYVEVENFAAESTPGRHETELQGEYAILDTDGKRVASSVLPLDKQVSTNRRHDYFIAYRVFLPEKIEAGHYTLQLTMQDVKGNKSNQADIEFWIR